MRQQPQEAAEADRRGAPAHHQRVELVIVRHDTIPLFTPRLIQRSLARTSHKRFIAQLKPRDLIFAATALHPPLTPECDTVSSTRGLRREIRAREGSPQRRAALLAVRPQA